MLKKIDISKMESVVLEVQSKQVYVLEDVSEQAKDFLETEIKKYPMIRFYAIFVEHSFQIILNIRQNDKNIDDKLLDKVRKHYIDEQYEVCIDLLKKFYCSCDMPTTYPIYKIGLCFYKLHRKNLAISYLKAANAMNQELYEMNDFSNFLFSLQGLISDRDAKKWCIVKEEEFTKSLETIFSVCHFEEIKKLVLHLGMHIEDACFHFGLTKEEFNMTKLLIAKEYYKMGNFRLGDMYYNMPIKKEGQTKDVKRLAHEVKHGKKFFQYR